MSASCDGGSQAFVMVVSDAAPSTSTVFELGAAQGWNKPVYVVVADPASMHLPSFLHGLPVYPYSRIEEIARTIKDASASLNETETSLLIHAYERMAHRLTSC